MVSKDELFSTALKDLIASSSDPTVRAAPDGIALLLELDEALPHQYGWGQKTPEALAASMKEAGADIERVNALFWHEMMANIEAFGTMSAWRGSDILRASLTDLNEGHVVAPAIGARALLELSSFVLISANKVHRLGLELDKIPSGELIGGGGMVGEVLQMFDKLLHGTKNYGDKSGRPTQYDPTHFLKKIAKKDEEVLDVYSYLCDLTHAGALGYQRYWTGTGWQKEDLTGVHLVRREHDGLIANEIREKTLWALAHGSAMLRNGVLLAQGTVGKIVDRWPLALTESPIKGPAAFRLPHRPNDDLS